MKKTASAFCSDTVLGLIKGMCVWYPHTFYALPVLFKIEIPTRQRETDGSSAKFTLCEPTQNCQNDKQYISPASKALISQPSLQMDDIFCACLIRALTSRWPDSMYTHTRSQIFAPTWAYTNTGAHLMQIRRETQNESLVLSLFPILLPRRACLWQMYNVTGRGKKKKVVFPGKSRPANHISPCPTLWQIPSFKLGITDLSIWLPVSCHSVNLSLQS